MNIIFLIVVAFIGNCIAQASPDYLNSYDNTNEEDPSSPDYRQLGSDANSNISPNNAEAWNNVQNLPFVAGPDESSWPLQQSPPLADYNQQNDNPEAESNSNQDWSWNQPSKGLSGYDALPVSQNFEDASNDPYQSANLPESEGYRGKRSEILFNPDLVDDYDTMEDDQLSDSWVQQW